jgi:hypothetical protein
MEQIISYFVGSETPFLLLFVVLFWFFIKEAKAREERMNERNKELMGQIEGEIKQVSKDLKVMLTVWKIIIDHELDERSKANEYNSNRRIDEY